MLASLSCILPQVAVSVFTVSLFPFSSLIATFLISQTKIPDKKQIKREGAYSDLWLEVFPFTMVGMVWWQENEAAGHIAFMVRRQRKTFATVQVAWSPGIPVHGMVHPYSSRSSFIS